MSTSTYFPTFGPMRPSTLAMRGFRFATDPDGSKPEPKPDADDALGDAGKKALQEERDARRKAEAELKKFKDEADKKAKDELSEVDRLKAENAEKDRTIASLTHENRQFKIGLENKVDPTLIPRLRGDDDEAMKADAVELARLNPGAKTPKADPSQGRKGGDGNQGLTPAQEFGDTIDELFDKG